MFFYDLALFWCACDCYRLCACMVVVILVRRKVMSSQYDVFVFIVRCG